MNYLHRGSIFVEKERERERERYSATQTATAREGGTSIVKPRKSLVCVVLFPLPLGIAATRVTRGSVWRSETERE